MGPEKRKKAEYKSSKRSKEKIKEALLSIMEEKGVEHITITEVVRKARINRGTFYAHFENLSDVLNVVKEDAVSLFLKVAEEFEPDEIVKNPEEFFKSVASVVRENEEYLKRLIRIHSIPEIITEIKEALIKYVEKSEFIRTRPDGRYASQMLDYTASGAIYTFVDILSGEISMEIDEVPRFLADIAMRLARSSTAKTAKIHENQG